MNFSRDAMEVFTRLTRSWNFLILVQIQFLIRRANVARSSLFDVCFESERRTESNGFHLICISSNFVRIEGKEMIDHWNKTNGVLLPNDEASLSDVACVCISKAR